MTDREHDSDRTDTFVVLTAGTMVNHYRIVKKIGAGGMGEVYLAEDSRLNRSVALKFMPGHLATDANMRARFVREAQAAAKLDHPHIVPVYEVGEFRNRPYIAMAHVEGDTLRDIIRRGDLSVSDCVELAIQICDGLQAAHDSGVIHRDIKPGNIVIDRADRARILDFGLASIVGEEKLTRTGSTLGTVGYMAPEQIAGKRADKRADLFSVGVILYEMLTGRRPFTGETEAAVTKAITDATPEPIARFKSGVSADLQQIVDKALTKDPSHRYQHADGLMADLKKILDDSRAASKLTASSGSRKLTYGTLGAAILLVLAAVFWFAGPDQSEGDRMPGPTILAVLPFENLGSDEDDYFSKGITSEIRSRLVGVEGMRVISPSSTDNYERSDQSPEEIGRELNADFILDGTIRWDKSGDVDLIRIGPRLTQTSDGYLMWADNYQRELNQIFEVQANIADEIVTALGLTLFESDATAPDYAPTDNMQAYNYYLRGVDIMSEGVFMANLREAIAMFDSAIALDPDFAVAWAKKAVAHTEYDFGHITGDDSEQARRAREAAEKALELNPTLPDAHLALGQYYNFIEKDYDRALAEFAKAESEVASNADLSQAIGVVKMREGKWQEAIANFEKAIRIDPLTVRRYYWLSTVHSYLRDFEKANEYIDRALVLDPDNGDAVYQKVLFNLLEYGEVDSPTRSFESIVDALGTAAAASYEIAPSTSPGFWRFIMDRIDPDRMIRDLRELLDDRSPYLVYMNMGHLFQLAGQPDSARVYLDTCRELLKKNINQHHHDFHIYANLAMVNGLTGRYDEAIAAGKRATEMMSVDDCHW